MMPRDQELVCNLPVLNLALKARKMGEIMLRFEGKGHTEVFCGFFWMKVDIMVILNSFRL